MSQTTLLIEDPERPMEPARASRLPLPGSFHLAAPPATAPTARASAEAIVITAERPSETQVLPPLTWPETRREALRPYMCSHWYDIGVALLILGSGVVALYRLMWIGQP